MSQLVPIMLRASAVRACIVGGGVVGLRRANSFAEAGVAVRMVSPVFAADVPERVERVVEAFAEHHLDGCNLVIAATDVPAVNEAVQAACVVRGIWCCRADDASRGDFIVPAVERTGAVTTAVSAGSPTAAKHVLAAVAPAAEFAAAVAAVRPVVLAATDDPARRQAAMRDAASPDAASIFAIDGADGLRLYLARRHDWLRHVLGEP
jgi:hypothetical protein